MTTTIKDVLLFKASNLVKGHRNYTAMTECISKYSKSNMRHSTSVFHEKMNHVEVESSQNSRETFLLRWLFDKHINTR